MMMLSPRWGWSDVGVATADAAWRAPSHGILVLVLQCENITAVGTTPTPCPGRGGRSGRETWPRDRVTIDLFGPVAGRSLVPLPRRKTGAASRQGGCPMADDLKIKVNGRDVSVS